MTWRPRTSEPSNLHLWQYFGKPHFIRVCLTKPRFYGAWINDNCSVFAPEWQKCLPSSNSQTKGSWRNGWRYTPTLAWMKCITVPLGWWCRSRKIFSAGAIGSTMPVQRIKYNSWAWCCVRPELVVDGAQRRNVQAALWLWLNHWGVGVNEKFPFYLHHCISPKLDRMFQVQCRFHQTCYSKAFKQTVCLNQSPTAYPELHQGLIPSKPSSHSPSFIPSERHCD